MSHGALRVLSSPSAALDTACPPVLCCDAIGSSPGCLQSERESDD